MRWTELKAFLWYQNWQAHQDSYSVLLGRDHGFDKDRPNPLAQRSQ